MQILYDEHADSVIIDFSEGKPAKSHEISDDLVVYTDAEGRLV